MSLSKYDIARCRSNAAAARALEKNRRKNSSSFIHWIKILQKVSAAELFGYCLLISSEKIWLVKSPISSDVSMTPYNWGKEPAGCDDTCNPVPDTTRTIRVQ